MSKFKKNNSGYTLIIRQSEPLWIDDNDTRLWRASLIHKYCQNLNYNSVFLTSTFSHYNRKQRFLKTTWLSKNENNSFVFIKTPGYKRNISISRFIDHLVFGFKAGVFIIKERKNINTIFTSHPTVDGAFIATILGRFFCIKVIVDVRDLWPDLFYDILGKSLIKRAILKLALLPYNLMTILTFSLVQNVSAPTQTYLEWANCKSLTKKKKNLIKLPFCYPTSYRNSLNIQPKFLKGYKGYKVCVFIGTLNGNMFDFDPITTAVKKYNKQVVFVIAGEGNGKSALQKHFHNEKNVLFPGWLSKEEILNLMNFSDFALAPYIPIDNFKMHIPNKIIEYLYGGLPIIYSVKGEMDLLLKNCGFRYDKNARKGSNLCFENVVDKILSNNKLLELLSNNAKQLFKNEFRADIVYKNFITTFF